ncbi:hypothetical protein [Haladaptatus sp. DYSN1]|uniref:hypothetical protein n=1 Tax=unclassified Haladaptatus TaxID=2622732 RepID=UPI002406950F|nr:hypothetical protein [Haladaptatus sp. DYSN1]
MRRRAALKSLAAGGSLLAGCSTLGPANSSSSTSEQPTHPRITLRQQTYDENRRIIEGGLTGANPERRFVTLLNEAPETARFNTDYLSQFEGSMKLLTFVKETDFDRFSLFIFQAVLPSGGYSLQLTELLNANGTVHAKLTEQSGNGDSSQVIETLTVRFEKSNYFAANFYVRLTTADGRVEIIDSG